MSRCLSSGTRKASSSPGEAQDRQSASAAENLARKLALTSAGAVALSRTGEPATGDVADAVVIRTFGEVPSMEELLVGE